jgi:hypothetical protein
MLSILENPVSLDNASTPPCKRRRLATHLTTGSGIPSTLILVLLVLDRRELRISPQSVIVFWNNR